MRRGTLFILLVALAAFGCERQGSSSKSNSPVQRPPASGGAQRFAAAHAIFQNICASCHTDFATWTEAEFLAAPNSLVVQQNAQASRLFQRLRGSGFGQATMPQAGQWTTGDLTVIRDWINRIGTDPEPSPSPSPSPSPTGPNAAQRRAAALSALQINGCLGCHTTTKTATSTAYSGATVPAYGDYTTDTAFVTNGLILPGNATDSWLYRALRGYGNIGFMPIGGGMAQPAEAQAIRDWIDNLANP